MAAPTLGQQLSSANGTFGIGSRRLPLPTWSPPATRTTPRRGQPKYPRPCRRIGKGGALPARPRALSRSRFRRRFVAFRLADPLDRHDFLALGRLNTRTPLRRAGGEADALDRHADQLAAIGDQHDLVAVPRPGKPRPAAPISLDLVDGRSPGCPCRRDWRCGTRRTTSSCQSRFSRDGQHELLALRPSPHSARPTARLRRPRPRLPPPSTARLRLRPRPRSRRAGSRRTA